MAANLDNSQVSGKRPTKKTKQPTTPAEAAQLLQSAIAYCNEAGLRVSGFNHENTLRFQVDGINYLNGEIVVTSNDNVGRE